MRRNLLRVALPGLVVAVVALGLTPQALADTTVKTCSVVSDPGSVGRFTDCHGQALTGGQFSTLDLRGADFSGAVLTNADLSGTDLTPLRGYPASGTDQPANLTLSVLNGANLTGSHLDGATLYSVIANGANMSGMVAPAADFRVSSLNKVDLTGSNLSGADLSSSAVQDGDLSHANLSGTIWSNATLAGSNATGADFSGAHFGGSDLSRVILTGATFTGSSLLPSDITLTSTVPLAVTWQIPAPPAGVSTSCLPASGTVFGFGKTTVTCTVSSTASVPSAAKGTHGSGSFVVDVIRPAVPGTFRSVRPARLLDTRTGNGAVGPVPASTSIAVQILGRGGVPATGVSAVVINLTVTQPKSAGYLTVYPDGTPRPATSNLGFLAGQTIANLVVVPIGTDGKIRIHNASANTSHLIADVAGYYLG